MFFKVLTSLALGLLPIAILIRDWKFHDKRTKRHHKITRGILVVWLIAGLTSVFFVWYETSQSNELNAKVNNLVTTNETLQSKVDNLSPFISLVIEKYGKADREAILNLTSEVQKIMNPEIVFLNRRIEQNKNEETGEYKTSYYFRSKHPTTIYEMVLYLEFSVPVSRAQLVLERTAMLGAKEDDLKVVVLPSQYAVACRARVLPDVSQAKITITTKDEPQLVKYVLCPPERNRKLIQNILENAGTNQK